MKANPVDWKGDLLVVNAARASFSKVSNWQEDLDGNYWAESFTLSEKDARLIQYLAEHSHWLPFRHPQMTFQCSAPLFVARQAGKHQVGMSWSEVSRRYVDETPEFYIPEVWRKRADNVKQGSSDEAIVIKGSKGVCPYCKDEFISRNNRQKFCTPKCQGKAYKITNKGWRVAKLERLKISAQERGIPIDLVADDIPMPETCVYLSIKLDYSANAIQDNSPSVDRVDNRFGYTKNNIQTISHKANAMKNSANKEELVEFAKSVLTLHGGYLVPQIDSVGQFYSEMQSLYRNLVDQGVCPEQARGFMPQSQMTEWVWTGSLLAWAHFVKQRTERSAQKEIRDFAEMFVEPLADEFPYSWAALMQWYAP